MHTATADIIVLGGGGAGLRAAIAAAELNPGLEIALVSKVVPMRSHTVVAEGGSAGVIRPDDSSAMPASSATTTASTTTSTTPSPAVTGSVNRTWSNISSSTVLKR